MSNTMVQYLKKSISQIDLNK